MQSLFDLFFFVRLLLLSFRSFLLLRQITSWYWVSSPSRLIVHVVVSFLVSMRRTVVRCWIMMSFRFAFFQTVFSSLQLFQIAKCNEFDYVFLLSLSFINIFFYFSFSIINVRCIVVCKTEQRLFLFRFVLKSVLLFTNTF